MKEEEKENLLKELENERLISEYRAKEINRLREILSAIGIAYETFKKEFK